MPTKLALTALAQAHGSALASLREARLKIAYYLDTYFNLDRHHSALGAGGR